MSDQRSSEQIKQSRIVTTQEKIQANEEIKNIKENIAGRNKQIQVLLKEIDDNEKNEKDSYSNYRRLAVALSYLHIVNYYLSMYDISSERLKSKNENYLNDARKNYFNALIQVENVVTRYIDTTLTENNEILDTISSFNPARKLELLRMFDNLASKIEEGYGKNSKWTPQIVEAEGRFAAVLKNILDYREMQTLDPRKAYYEQHVILSQFVREKLRKASERYRDKYTLGNREVDDIRKAIEFREALRKIAAAFGEEHEADMCKKLIDNWNAMLEKDLKQKDKEKKRRAAMQARKSKTKK